jgi:hypothetical protein
MTAMRCRAAALAAAVTVALVGFDGLLSAQTTPASKLLVGTWKFNPRKSQMRLTLPPRELTRTYEDVGNGVYVLMQTGRLADGSRLNSMFVGRDDGREYPLAVQDADDLPAAYVSIRLIDAWTAEQRERVAGVLPEFGRASVVAIRKLSPDGKTMTLTIGAPPVDPNARPDFVPEVAGSAESDVMVFEKQ